MDPRAFERIYERHAPAVAAYALRRVRSEQDAEEIVSANQARRAGRAAVELSDDLMAPLDTTSERAELVAAVLRLPELERDALLLTVWEGLDQQACARALGCTRVAVALRLRRARARLRDDASIAPTPRLIPKGTR